MSAADATPAAVQLHIERIVIDGVALSRLDAGRLRGALQAELARLLAAGPRIALHGAALHCLSAPAIAITTPVRPLELGRAIARSVHTSLTGGA